MHIVCLVQQECFDTLNCQDGGKYFAMFSVLSLSLSLEIIPAFSQMSTTLSCLFVAIWKHPEPCPSGGKRGEAARRLHAVLQRSGLHQEDWSGERGQHTPKEIN